MRASTYLAILLLPFASHSAALELVFTCPKAFPAVQAATDQAWQSLAVGDSQSAPARALPMKLTGMALYSGHPRERASLVPDADKSMKGIGRLASWKFQGEHWVGCNYANSLNMLIRPLPGTATACEMHYHVSSGKIKIGRFACGEVKPLKKLR